MPAKKYFTYIRVSTQRQGQSGTSLTEQQAAIERFANSWNLPIIKRFEERETAAKQGRPVFLEMLKELRQERAHGVIIHKIDRSARNLKDWADLGSLIDSGIEVHFASESLDLSSRGGRLSADIQAVVASDYIRNLREETKKGLYGRLKQGLFPFRAAVGYLDKGKGQPKKIDPIAGPLVRQAFELYSTGDWSLIALVEKMEKLGLQNKQGKRVSLNGLSTMLHNPFYMGVIRIKKTNELFPGIHVPIISKSLFDLVQNVLSGKNIRKTQKHFYTYRRTIRCIKCEYHLIPETQKGHVYYRCHTKQCSTTCLKDEAITQSVLTKLMEIQFSNEEYVLLKQMCQRETGKLEDETKKIKTQILFQQSTIKERLSSLVDAYMDGVFDKDTYLEKKNGLVVEDQALKENLVNLEASGDNMKSVMGEFLELANSAYLSYKVAKPEAQRDLVKILTSNFRSDGKSVLIDLKMPFQLVANRVPFTAGSPCRDTARTVPALISQLIKFFEKSNLAQSKADLGLLP